MEERRGRSMVGGERGIELLLICGWDASGATFHARRVGQSARGGGLGGGFHLSPLRVELGRFV